MTFRERRKVIAVANNSFPYEKNPLSPQRGERVRVRGEKLLATT
jgi:hypothetical protein